MKHDDVVIAAALMSSVGGLLVLAGLAVFFINGGVIDRVRRVRRRRPVSPVSPPRWCVEALADVARAHRLLTRERLRTLQVCHERDRWMSIAGDLWSQLEQIPEEDRDPILCMYLAEYKQMAGMR